MEGVGVEVVMVDMETTKVGTTKVDTTKVGITRMGTTKMAGTTIIKADMVAMIIKVGTAVDMATTKAGMETTKKMVDITEGVVVYVEEASSLPFPPHCWGTHAVRKYRRDIHKSEPLCTHNSASRGRGGID